MKRIITVQLRMTMKRSATQQEVLGFVRRAISKEIAYLDVAPPQPNAPVEIEPAPVVKVVHLETHYTKE